MKYIVRISDNALKTMILNGLEAYEVRHKINNKNHTHVETFGLLWGTMTKNTIFDMYLYNIDFISIDTSAEKNKGYVKHKFKSAELKELVMNLCWPNLSFLGDFHTHPERRSLDAIKKYRLYEFSNTDKEAIEIYSDKYKVGLVLTIKKLKRPGRSKKKNIDDSTIEFTLGYYRFWLKSYVAGSSKGNAKLTYENEKIVVLDCQPIMGIMCIE